MASQGLNWWTCFHFSMQIIHQSTINMNLIFLGDKAGVAVSLRSDSAFSTFQKGTDNPWYRIIALIPFSLVHYAHSVPTWSMSYRYIKLRVGLFLNTQLKILCFPFRAKDNTLGILVQELGASGEVRWKTSFLKLQTKTYIPVPTASLHFSFLEAPQVVPTVGRPGSKKLWVIKYPIVVPLNLA